MNTGDAGNLEGHMFSEDSRVYIHEHPSITNLNTAAHSFPQCNTGCMASSAKQVLFESQRLTVVSVSPINLYLKTSPQTAAISGEQMVEWMCSNESQGSAPCFNTLIMNTEKKSLGGL